MTLRTVAVPNPAAGVDWITAVPGQYIYDVTGITATLTSAAPFAAMVDSSGHGRNGTYTHSGGYPHSTTGLVAGDAAIITRDPNTLGNASGGNMPTLGFDRMGDLSIEFWAALPQVVDQTGFVCSWSAFSPARRVWLTIGNGGFLQFNRQDPFTAETYEWDCSATITDGLAHQFVCAHDSTDTVLYLDGVAQAPTSSSAFVAYAAMDPVGTCFENNSPLSGVNGTVDELSIYSAKLTAGQAAAHYAAGLAGIGPYSAVVLADSPAAYYHLNDGASNPREVALFVTNGLVTVENIPTGFSPPPPPGPYRYSWQPNLQASSQLPNGTLTTVAIAPLVLPAGYTIGTDTLGGLGLDRWSNITVWWSDDVMNGLQPITPYAYPPGVLLLSRYATRPR